MQNHFWLVISKNLSLKMTLKVPRFKNTKMLFLVVVIGFEIKKTYYLKIQKLKMKIEK